MRYKKNKFGSVSFLTVLSFLLILSTTSLMVVNYLTIKTMSATRSFITGESTFAKAEKDGSRHLQLYLHTSDEKYYDLYNSDLELIIADSMALHGMLHNAMDDNIIRYFLQGRNNPEDDADMVWLAKNFKNATFLDKNFKLWQTADSMINIIHQRAIIVHGQIQLGVYSRVYAANDIFWLNIMSDRLTVVERLFSVTMNRTSREVRQYLLLGEFVMIILILGMNFLFASNSIRTLLLSGKQLTQKNIDLTETNIELDRFVYSASHELRKPISSLKGLLSLIREETDPGLVRSYLSMMEKSLNLQDESIREIINYSRNKRTKLNNETINIERMLTDIIRQHQFTNEGRDLKFNVHSTAGQVSCDALRLKIILGNIISNAVKFSDPAKAAQVITICSSVEQQVLEIDVTDNGIGIEEKSMEKIFEMFYLARHIKQGSGLGLYIARETILRMGGTISLKSSMGEGTTFSVRLPLLLSEKVPG